MKNYKMTQTIARIKKAGKHFEILVDLDEAMKFKKGQTDSIEAQGDRVFTDSKKGETPPQASLEEAFGTTDVNEIAKEIVKKGEVQETQDYRDEEREKKKKQVVDFLVKNAIDPKTGNPHTPERIKGAIDEINANIKNSPVENQISEIVEQLKEIIPIKIETKKIKINIPAIQTGKAYGVISDYKVQEEWQNDGSLDVIVEVPSGIIIDFYDKLNSVTHGSATTEEIKE